jgi:hypothetical protein
MICVSKSIFARACTAKKYRKAGSVQIDRKAADLCAEPAQKNSKRMPAAFALKVATTPCRHPNALTAVGGEHFLFFTDSYSD